VRVIGILAGILLGAIGAVGVGAVGAALESATTMRTLFAALWSSLAPKPSIERGKCGGSVFAMQRRNSVECVRCGQHFEVMLPDAIIGGPFLPPDISSAQ
jgi:hypothetical protein